MSVVANPCWPYHPAIRLHQVANPTSSPQSASRRKPAYVSRSPPTDGMYPTSAKRKQVLESWMNYSSADCSFPVPGRWCMIPLADDMELSSGATDGLGEKRNHAWIDRGGGPE